MGGNGLNLTSETPNPLPSFSAPRGNVCGKNKLIGKRIPPHIATIYICCFPCGIRFLPNSLQKLLTFSISVIICTHQQQIGVISMRLKKYSLMWWYMSGKEAKKSSYTCRSHSKSYLCDLAYRLGYWAA